MYTHVHSLKHAHAHTCMHTHTCTHIHVPTCTHAHTSYVNLALDCSVKVFVSAVCSPDLFYVQLPEYEEMYVLLYLYRF